MLDDGETDVFLLLIEAVKTPEKFKRVAEKALKAGKPIIVGKIGQSEPGRARWLRTPRRWPAPPLLTAPFSHTTAWPKDAISTKCSTSRPASFLRQSLPAGNRVGICTASGGAGVWTAHACAAAGLDVPVLDDATRAALDVDLPSYATSQNPVDSTAQGVQKLGYAQFARLVARSPSIDSVIVVITARRSAFNCRTHQAGHPVNK